VLISGAIAADTTAPLVPLGDHACAASQRPAPSSLCRMR
jgi:hypothetical protein